MSLADLQPGEVVLDLGSGFGVDAILAGSKVGDRGRVVGVDLSLREVKDANRRVLDRGVKNVRFYRMDIERLAAIPDAVRTNSSVVRLDPLTRCHAHHVYLLFF